MSRVVIRVRPKLEKHEQAGIVMLLKSMGALIYTLGTRRPKGESQTTRQTAGLPDLIAFLKPAAGHTARLLMIEVKRRGGRLSPEQKQFEAACHNAGVLHIVGGLDDVIRWLMEHGYLHAGSVGHYHQQSRSQWED